MSTLHTVTDAVVRAARPGTLVRAAWGRRWTAVVAEVEGEVRAGLAATWSEGDPAEAGTMQWTPGEAAAWDLVAQIGKVPGRQASLSAAALNALLPATPDRWTDERAEEAIARRGAGKEVVVIGHFPFVEALRPRVGRLTVLEERPHPGDLPAAAAPQVLPGAEVVAITGMAFVNGTLESLLRLCAANAYVIVAGPSTPLCPVLFDYGVDQLCGVVVEQVDAVLEAVQAGGRFHAVHQAGARLVSLAADRAA